MKFLEEYPIEDFEIFTDTGWKPAINSFLTVPMETYEIETKNCLLRCADRHIIFLEDYSQIFAEDLLLGNRVITSFGVEEVISIRNVGTKEPMFDIEIDSENHRYFTDDILSHNTNIGKSLVLCHLAAGLLRSGKNVLYITGEMSEKMIGKRIDANLLDMDVNELGPMLDKTRFLGGIKDIYKKTEGKLIIKEYPAGVANANHIKNLLNEIKLKRGFVPDVIVLDYLNLFASSRLGANAMMNSYTYVKAVAEEMRGLAVMFDLALITASQVNRSNANNSDVDMTGTSESFGLPMTCDWMAAIIQTPELFEQLKFIFKNIKSRFNSNINSCVTIGVDYGKMRLVNLGDADQEIPVSVRDALAFQKKKEAQNNLSEINDFDFSS